MRPPGSAQELERRRRRAIELLQQGEPPAEVAQIVGCDRRSVRRWSAAFRKRGAPGLKARAAPGRPPRLDARARKSLERALLRGAVAAGFPTDLWTCPRVAQVIERRFAITYHVDHVCRLLHGLGWSPQKPQRRAVERDEEEIQRWVKQEWPRIKRGRRG
jgi:transposase